MSDPRFIVDAKKMKKIEKNTIKAGGSTARAQNVWVGDGVGDTP